METVDSIPTPRTGDLPQQRYLQAIFPEIEQLFDHYHRPKDSLRNFRQEIDAFTARNTNTRVVPDVKLLNFNT